MTSRRRVATKPGASLPASRLPLGTPIALLQQKSESDSGRFTSKATAGSCQFDRERTSSSPPSSPPPKHQHNSPEPFTASEQGENIAMPSDHAPEAQLSSTSLADLKLARQNKRNLEAEAALNHPPALPSSVERPRPGSKKSSKTWKPFDFTGDSSPSNDSQPAGHQSGVQLGDARTNVFHGFSRASSLSSSRPTSRLSLHPTNNIPAAAEMERQDSSLDSGGVFQPFTGRRNKKGAAGLNAFEVKPEERQNTVEATFNKREVYDVFGNELPGPDFMDQNVGYRNGQVQFVQHPNGDVSAHQWSNIRYIWENIGQYSNIRKRTEGQLASDRLKGETASQVLRQNTLAYFRTIAKQREANIMGLPFGAKEVQSYLPDIRASQGPIYPLPHQANLKVEPSAYESESKALHKPDQNAYNPSVFDTLAALPQLPARFGQQYNQSGFPSGSETTRFGNYEDPFYSAGHDFRSYEDTLHRPHRRMSSAHAQQPGSLNQAFSFPQYQEPISQQQEHGYSAHYDEPSAFIAQMNWLQQQQEMTALQQQEMAALQQQRESTRAPNCTSHQGMSIYGSTADDGKDWSQLHGGSQYHGGSGYHGVSTAPTSRPQAPLDTSNRNALKEGLIKLGETAKERSLSQTNLAKYRTVLRDDGRDREEPAPQPSIRNQLQEQSYLPSYLRNMTSNTTESDEVESMDPPATDNHLIPVPAATLAGGTAAHAYTVESTNEEDSVTVPADPNKPESTIKSPLEEVIRGSYPDVSGDTPARRLANDPAAFFQPVGGVGARGTRSYDEELNDWFLSRNRFQRQEDFFQRIRDDALKEKEPRVSNPGLVSHSRFNSTFQSRTEPDTTASSGSRFGAVGSGTPSSRSSSNQQQQPQPQQSRTTQPGNPFFNEANTRVLIPVLENLSSYVQGPAETRRDYFSNWCEPPAWAIDNSPHGNDSFYDRDWAHPPARLARDDPRSQRLSSSSGGGEHASLGGAERARLRGLRFGSFDDVEGGASLGGPSAAVGGPVGSAAANTTTTTTTTTTSTTPAGGLDRRFEFLGLKE